MSILPANLDIEQVDGVSTLGREEWDRLLGEGTPFLEYGFLSTLEETGCVGEGTGWFPAILTARDEEGRLFGAVPLYLKTHSRGEFVFDWGWADAASRAGIHYYPKAVVAVPHSPVSGTRILTDPELGPDDAHALRKVLVEATVRFAEDAELSSVHFNFIEPLEVGAFEELDIPTRLGVQYHWYNGRKESRWDGSEGLYEDFDDFLSEFRSKKRSNIRRERRKLAEAGVTSRVLTGDDVDLSRLDRAFEYYRATVRKFYWGNQYLNRDFFHAVGHALHDRIHLTVLEDEEGNEFAGTFNLFKDDRLYGRYWGTLNHIDFDHFEACFYCPIEWCIEHGVRVFEPGAGGEHKTDRGFEPTRTYSAHWIADHRLDIAVRDAIRRERLDVERRIAHLEENSPFKSST